MCTSAGSELQCFGQGSGITLVRLHAPSPRGVHRRIVDQRRWRRGPGSLGAALPNHSRSRPLKNTRWRAVAENSSESLTAGDDASLAYRSIVAENAELTLALGQIKS